MALKLTPEMLEAAYDLLCAMPPFRGWRMLPAEEVIFHVAGYQGNLGMCWFDPLPSGRSHHLGISVKGVAHTDTLVRTMAHEMVHLYQHMHSLENKNQHNADFKRRAKRVCQIHGFDPALFC